MSALMWTEARWMLCGPKIGEGAARKVYACRLDPTKVVKIERKGGSFQNVLEHEAWSYIHGKRAAWLAPVRFISPCGTILVQDRVDPIRTAELPKRLLKFLTDIKSENFGKIGKRVVCFDYGTLIASLNLAPLSLAKADWRS